MLYSIALEEMSGIPHEDQYRVWRSRISDGDYEAVEAAINEYCETHDVFVSSHIPGPDWTGTVYDALYEACARNREHSGFFFGVIVWLVLIERDDEWLFKPADKDGDDVLGTTYWRKSD